MGTDNHNYFFLKITHLLLDWFQSPSDDHCHNHGTALIEGTGVKTLCHSHPTTNYNKWKQTVFTANGLKLPSFLSRPSFSCSFSGRMVCGTSFSFSWSGSLESAAPPSPWLWRRSPPFPRCSDSASKPRCSDPPPVLSGDPSHWEFRLSTDARRKGVRNSARV